MRLGVRKRLYRMLELPDEAADKIPCVQLCSNSSLSISECRRVLAYGGDMISLQLSDGVITIRGKELSMRTFYRSVVSICGVISQVNYERD